MVSRLGTSLIEIDGLPIFDIVIFHGVKSPTLNVFWCPWFLYGCVKKHLEYEHFAGHASQIQRHPGWGIFRGHSSIAQTHGVSYIFPSESNPWSFVRQKNSRSQRVCEALQCPICIRTRPRPSTRPARWRLRGLKRGEKRPQNGWF